MHQQNQSAGGLGEKVCNTLFVPYPFSSRPSLLNIIPFLGMIRHAPATPPSRASAVASQVYVQLEYVIPGSKRSFHWKSCPFVLHEKHLFKMLKSQKITISHLKHKDEESGKSLQTRLIFQHLRPERVRLLMCVGSFVPSIEKESSKR